MSVEARYQPGLSQLARRFRGQHFISNCVCLADQQLAIFRVMSGMIFSLSCCRFLLSDDNPWSRLLSEQAMCHKATMNFEKTARLAHIHPEPSPNPICKSCSA